MRPLDHEARSAAGEQRFLITRSQLLALGDLDERYRRWLRSGQWESVHPGVYQIDSRPRTWEDRVLAAVLAAGDSAAASHRAALVLWGLDGLSKAPVEIVVPHSHSPVPAGTVVRRTRRPYGITVLRTVPVTPVERTLLDCAAVLPRLIVTKAVESSLRKRLTTLPYLYGFLSEFGGRGVKGTRMFRGILNSRASDTATGSGSETEALYRLRRAGVTEPLLQHRFVALDGDPIHPDFYWPTLNKAVEIDGIDAHDSADKLDHDLQRQNKLMDLGVELRRFSARQVRRDPSGFVADVRRFLAP
ncbi:MAG TPA: hypothetical protein VFO17_06470 [Acidimicrobiia bacterium]|nr:hypothetical protein [Acidimicrobiia bacterium]